MHCARIEALQGFGATPDFFSAMSDGSDEDPGPEPRRRRRRRRGHRGFGGPGGGQGHGRRAKRGDIRVAILLLLDEEPRNGYGIMQEIEERSGGVWRPSPGSVYPALAQLEDEGLVEPTEAGRKAFTLTEAGSAKVEADRKTEGPPWKSVGEGASTELHDLREASQGLKMATMQVARTGDPEQLNRAVELLERARKGIYRLLAGDDPAESTEDTEG